MNALLITDKEEIKELIKEAVKEIIDANIVKTPLYYTNVDLCRLFHCAPGTLAKLRKEGLIEACKISGRIVYQKEYIDNILKSNNVPTLKGLQR